MKKFGILILLLCACGTPKTFNSISTNKAEDYDFKSQKIFIVAYEGEEGGQIIQDLTTHISNSLYVKGVENKIHMQKVDGLALQQDFPRDEVMNYRPDTILLVALNGGSFMNGELTDLELVGSLIDPMEEKLVWRAKLNSEKSSGYGGINQNEPLRFIAMDFVDKMESDGLLATSSGD
jgi:hypothetical protein